MSEKPNLEPLSDHERRLKLEAYLDALDKDPNFSPLRSLLPTRDHRQLALFAALERSLLVGSPAAAPPHPDDEPDQLLCDILEFLDEHPTLKNNGAYYGSYRHLANLQALGIWRGNAPVQRPCASELFTAHFSTLTADTSTTSPASPANNSPLSQDSAPNGELIGPASAAQAPLIESSSPPQTLDGVLVVTVAPNQQVDVEPPHSPGLIHHQTQTPGEKSSLSPSDLPSRPVRRGRPTKLDDFAKGRLLGLMSYGLSFRQAAAQLGVHHVTLLNALKRDEQFAQQVSEARLDAISQPLLTVINASRTNWRAAAWLTKYLADRTGSAEPSPQS